MLMNLPAANDDDDVDDGEAWDIVRIGIRKEYNSTWEKNQRRNFSND